MKTNCKTLLCFLLPLSLLSLLIAGSTHKEKEQKVSANTSEQLIITNEPFLKTLSLGSELYKNGLHVTFNGETIDNYTINGYKKDDLGEQEINIAYENYQRSFNVLVTNEYALVNDSIERELIISQVIVENNTLISFGLYNTTDASIDLQNYGININSANGTENINFDNWTIGSEESFSISFNDNIFGDLNYKLETSENVLAIELYKEQLISDVFKHSFIRLIAPETSKRISIIRLPSILKPNQKGTISEWFYTNNSSNFLIEHTINENIITCEKQAKAFARYVMFGPGMFAKGRVEEAFLALRTEFEFMHSCSVDYFLNNPKDKVTGYNEDGRYTEATFSDAYQRVNMLANNSGYTSFININLNQKKVFSNTLLFLLLLGTSLIIYLVLIWVYKKNNALH